MLLTLLLLVLLATSIQAHPASSPLESRTLFSRELVPETCVSRGLLSCTTPYLCCFSNQYCDGVGCCPIGKTCTGPVSVHTGIDYSTSFSTFPASTFSSRTSSYIPTSASSTTYLNTVTDAPVLSATSALSSTSVVSSRPVTSAAPVVLTTPTTSALAATTPTTSLASTTAPAGAIPVASTPTSSTNTTTTTGAFVQPSTVPSVATTSPAAFKGAANSTYATSVLSLLAFIFSLFATLF